MKGLNKIIRNNNSYRNCFKNFMIGIKKNLTFVLLIIFLLSISIRVFFANGLSQPDSFAYAKIANDIAQGLDFKPDWFYNFRFLFTYPLSLFFKIFGVSTHSVLIWPLLCFTIEFFVLIKILDLLQIKINKIIPALLIAFYPIDIKASVALLPDITLSVIFAISFCLVLIGLKNKKIMYLIASGLIVASGQFVKEYALIFNLILILVLILHIGVKDAKKYIFWLLIGNLIIIITVLLISYFKEKDFLYLYHNYISFRNIQISLIINQSIKNPISNFWLYSKTIFYSPNSPYFYLLFIGLAIAYKKRAKPILIYGIWIGVLFLFLQFGFLKFRPLIMIFKSERFLTILTIPVIITSAYSIQMFLSLKKIKPYLKRISKHILTNMLLTVTIVLIIIFFSFSHRHYQKSLLPDYYAANFLKTQKELPIVLLHEKMVSEYEFYFKYKKSFYVYGEDTINKPYYLVIDTLFFKGLYDEKLWIIENPDDQLITPPKSWEKIQEYDNHLFIYEVQT